jgi:hypothetical protein
MFTYRYRSFYDTPIITSMGVILGENSDGSFITGELPYHIQRAYVVNNQVPYIPFGSHSYSNNGNNFGSKSNSISYSSASAITHVEPIKEIKKEEPKESLLDIRKKEINIEKAVLEKTGIKLNNLSMDEFIKIKTIFDEQVKIATEQGIDKVTYKVKDTVKDHKKSKLSNSSSSGYSCASTSGSSSGYSCASTSGSSSGYSSSTNSSRTSSASSAYSASSASSASSSGTGRSASSAFSASSAGTGRSASSASSAGTGRSASSASSAGTGRSASSVSSAGTGRSASSASSAGTGHSYINTIHANHAKSKKD